MLELDILWSESDQFSHNLISLFVRILSADLTWFGLGYKQLSELSDMFLVRKNKMVKKNETRRS